ncbi:MAG: general secretion pathway protein GspK [Rhodobacteraceae bacterium]|nr:general secretion pathway protein GspK [Paracoccaceae bacterium]
MTQRLITAIAICCPRSGSGSGVLPDTTPNADGLQRGARGFVLPLTLWIVAILGLAIAAVNTWVQLAVENAIVLRDKTEDLRAAADLRNELVYLLATRPKTVRGIEIGGDLTLPPRSDFNAIMMADYSSNRALRVDGTSYWSETYPDIELRMQDGNGLVQLNTVNPAPIEGLLRTLDVEPSLRTRLVDTLRDFTDEDDFNRLSGAEARDYALLNRPPPFNQALLTPYHAREAIGWDQVPQLWQKDLESPLVTTCASSGFNPNTAPETALIAVLPRMTLEGAKKIIAARTQKPLRNQRETARASGISMIEEPFFYSFFPGPCVIVDMINHTAGERTRISLSLVPFSKVQPWRYDYELRIPYRTDPEQDADSATDIARETFPAPETLFAGIGRDN